MKVLVAICIYQYVAMDHDRQNYHLLSEKIIIKETEEQRRQYFFFEEKVKR